MTLAVVVFMSMLVLTAALVLVVDNLGRRRRTLPIEAVEAAAPERPRVIVRADNASDEPEAPAAPEVAAGGVSGSARREGSRWSGRR
jgi:hypothetical protein